MEKVQLFFVPQACALPPKSSVGLVPDRGYKWQATKTIAPLALIFAGIASGDSRENKVLKGCAV